MNALMHPKSRHVDAYVGPFASDHLGTYTGDGAPRQAIAAARAAGYRHVSLMYGNGNMETVGTAPTCHGCEDPENHPHAFDCERG